MKNITIAVPETVARWARVWAARNDTSVSAMLSQLLREKMESERKYSRAMKSFLTRAPAAISDGSDYPKRGEIHDR